MKKILLLIATLSTTLLYSKGFQGNPGEEAFAISQNVIHSRSLALNQLHAADRTPNLYQPASFDSLETISFQFSPGLYDERYSELAWYLNDDNLQFRSHFQYWDRGAISQVSQDALPTGKSDHPVAWVLQQGVAYKVSPKVYIGADASILMEHLTNHEELQNSLGGALHFGMNYLPGPRGLVWGLSVRNLGKEFITQDPNQTDLAYTNTTIQSGLSFRMKTFPRVKWSLGYELSAYDEPRAKISTEIYANRYMVLHGSSSLTHSRIYNSWNQFQGRDHQRTLAPSDFLGFGSQFQFREWKLDLAANLNQYDYQPIYSIGLEYIIF